MAGPPRNVGQQFGGPIGGPGRPSGPAGPPRPPYPPRAVAGALPYPSGGASFTTGALLNESFTVFFQNFLPFVFITAIVLAPAVILEIIVVVAKSRVAVQDQAMLDLIATIPRLMFAALPPIATGAISYGVFQQVRGKHVPFAEAVSVGFGRLLPVIGVSIVMTFAILVGYFACIIPGVYLSVILFAAVPAAVVERVGVMGSLNRSIELSDGFRWSIFGLIFAIGVIGFLLQMVAAFLLIVGDGVLALQIAGSVVQGAMQTVTVALQATAATLVYYRLRSIKESFDANELASVFD